VHVGEAIAIRSGVVDGGADFAVTCISASVAVGRAYGSESGIEDPSLGVDVAWKVVVDRGHPPASPMTPLGDVVPMNLIRRRTGFFAAGFGVAAVFVAG
jgi:hypothetical protein